MQKTAVVRFEKATVDDQIVQLARAGSVNLIADATYFSKSSTTVSAQWEENIWIYQLYRLVEDRRLSMERTTPGTVLLWSEPDFTAMARKILANGVVRDTPAPSDEELKVLLTDYFKQAYDWDCTSPGFSKELRLAELPPEVGRPLVARIQEYMLGDTMTHLRVAWFDDRLWSQAQLVRYREGRGGPEAVAVKLKVPGRGWSQIGIGWVGGGPGTATNTNSDPGTIEPAIVDAPPVVQEPLPEELKPSKIPVRLEREIAAAALSAEQQLKQPVSLGFRRISLVELLQLLEKQSGVKLVAADAPNARVTGYVIEMPLGDLMQSLSRLYGVRWNKEANGYSMHRSNLPDVERSLLSAGEFNIVSANFRHRWLKAQRPLPDEIIKNIPNATWKDGLAPFNSLPPELQVKVRGALEAHAAVSLVGYAAAVSQTTVSNYVLQLGDFKGYVGEKPAQWNHPLGDPKAAVYTREGTLELPVGDRKKMSG